MTSPYERPDRAALDALARTVTALEEELAAWRRRSQRAEQELADLRKGITPAGGGAELATSRQKASALESENQALRRRIAAAREELEGLRMRLRFVESHGTGDAA